jgi:hypothetical protein
MRRLFLVVALSAQAQNFPTTVSTTANIPAAVNRARTTLATTVNNSITTVVLTSASGFAVNTPFTIGTEDIICTSLSVNTFSSCTRGYDGSTAASHNAGVAVTGTIIAAHNNKLRLEVIALEQQAAARSLDYCADAGANDTYACSLAPPPSSYATGGKYHFKANTANTGAATINFNSLGAKTIVKVAGGVTTALEDNDIRAGQVVDVVYDGTNMQMQSTLGNVPSGSADEMGCGTTTSAPTTGTAMTCVVRTDTTPLQLWVFVATDTPYFVGTISDVTVAGAVTLSEATANGSNYRRLKVSDSLSSDVEVKFFEGTIPTDDDCLKATVASSVVRIEGAGAACGSGSGGGGLSGSSAIDFASLPDGGCLNNTFTITGLTAGQAISIGLPSSISSGILGTAIASATDTATIRLCNFSGSAVDLASLTYSANAPTAISASATINFGSIGDGICSTNTLTLTGAAAGTRVTPGWPAALESGLIGTMLATATDTITVRLCNWSGTALDPASATFSAAIY